MTNLILSAQPRIATTTEVNKVRLENKIPAIVYGHGFESKPVSLEYVNFEKVYKQYGTSSLIDLVIGEEKPIKVLIQDFQLHPISNRFSHVDLRQVQMSEKLKTEIKFIFVGESPAVKHMGGTLNKNLLEVHVECLPQDLVNEIDVDISALKEIGDVIHVKDLVVPAGIKILAHDEDVVASVSSIEVEEEAPIAPVVDLSKIKTENEEKKEKKAEGAAKEDVKKK